MLTSYGKAPAVACFAAAITGISVSEQAPTPTAEAALLSLTFTPASYAFGAGATTISFGSFGEGALILGQFNDGIGKTIYMGTSAPMAGIAIATSGVTITTATFSGAGTIGFGTAAAGTYYFAFETVGGDIGWFSVSMGGAGGTVTYIDGEIETTDGSITVGGVVPEPSSLALGALGALALGAAHLRRMREERDDLDETIAA